MSEIESADCKEFFDRLYEFVDGDQGALDQKQLSILEQHAVECSHCADAADVERHLRQLLRSACMNRAPEGLRAKLHARLEEISISDDQVSFSSSETVVYLRDN
ncbi:mycothiol system anti-sigma-R factor [Boudabousia liubingyangii]|uniref:Mycothiol system anti-sigma-R factor n=1 Tax=Boudabousia liubingyangii TaxID=1921764 RepID=A0A1Q5PKW0_9ACTO|nr:mycothiol system anti-sigma-R factor [Boudabousia liubingyangii]OKL46411.1 mycothiol system anti-sigma-R factor [Boudabousia liubingyangii]OKL47267.1 mycothiol system anti-sigma-R factor [Boudabousia liubingyangii]